jgi:PilZ domain
MERAERRRSPRVALNEPVDCTVPLRTRVKLLELSMTGTLVASDLPLLPGTTGQLRFAVAGSPCAGTVTVRRCATGSSGNVELGAMFTSMDDATRRYLEAFLRTPGA